MGNRNFRIETLKKIAQNLPARLQTAITQIEKPSTERIESNRPIFAGGTVRINSGVPGVTIFVPSNPIIGGQVGDDGKYKNGKYNVFGWIKPGNVIGRDGMPRSTLTNAIIVTAISPGDMLSSGHTRAFGNMQWWRTTLSSIDRAMKNHYGNVSLGRTAIASFSGGGEAIARMLAQGQNDPRFREEYERLNGVLILDGIHSNPNDANSSTKYFVNFARDAANNPNRRLVIVHSQITPQRADGSRYPSSRENAEYIASQVGAEYKPADERIGNLTPSQIARSGGVEIISAFDESRRRDNLDRLKQQHIDISNAAPDVVNLFAEQFNG